MAESLENQSGDRKKKARRIPIYSAEAWEEL